MVEQAKNNALACGARDTSSIKEENPSTIKLETIKRTPHTLSLNNDPLAIITLFLTAAPVDYK